MIGRLISHYRVVEELGAGGMGVVYRARDEQLDRDVAIKLLPPGLLADDASRKRFRKEALTLAKLQHPNIGTIYEFGTESGLDFLVMECIPGSTLAELLRRGPLPEPQALAIASQIAAALEEAHERGIVHCDLKPGNVLLSPKGQVKVLDFGLARLARPVRDDAITESLQDPAGLAGTLPYMAPEQLLGEPADARTDVHAFGALLYEMIAGCRAFPQPLVPQVTDAILHRPPLPPSALVPGVSVEVERIILKCLEKSLKDRYQSVKDLCVDLHRLSVQKTSSTQLPPPARLPRRRSVALLAVSAVLVLFLAALLVPSFRHWGERVFGLGERSRIASLAVLPTSSGKAGATHEYLADGIAGALTGDLSQVEALQVISQDSMTRFRKPGEPPEEIARQLNVDAVIVPAIQLAGNRLRLTLRLIAPGHRRPLWTHTFTAPLQQIPAMLGRVTEAVVAAAGVSLTPAERLRLLSQPPVDPSALDAYFRGLFFFFAAEKTEGGLARARAAFQQAIGADPNFAPAYAALAEAYLACDCSGRSRPAVITKAKTAALHALELDEDLASPHVSLGWIHMTYDYDWEEARRELKRAVVLSPGSADAHRAYATFLLGTGDFPESIRESHRAHALDPLSLSQNVALALTLYFARQEDLAAEQFRQTLDENHGAIPAHVGLGMVFAEEGHYEEAIAEFRKAVSGANPSPDAATQLARAYALMGRKAEAREMAQALANADSSKRPSAYSLATVYAALGDRNAALDWLEKAYQERDPDFLYLKIDPRLGSLRTEPRFQQLLARATIP
jgi:serine/threonine protein kinase/Tfp pilus assembly protein PilF